MVLNPTVKFKWLEENWEQSDYEDVRRSVRATMLEYQKAKRSPHGHTSSLSTSELVAPVVTPAATPVHRILQAPSASRAARAQTSGFAQLSSLARSLSTPTVTAAPTTSVPSEMTQAEKDKVERQLDAEDNKIVDDEIRKYEADGIIDDDHPEIHDFDLLRFWQSHQTGYELLWRIALDMLPAQASAVPCETVFSSSKETDTLRRSSLSPIVMEMLQILKYIFRNDRLSFTEDLVSTEEELSVIDVSPKVVEELLSTGKIDELISLLGGTETLSD